MIKIALYLYSLPPNHKKSGFKEKNIKQTPQRGISENTLLRTIKAITNKQCVRNCHSYEEPKEK